MPQVSQAQPRHGVFVTLEGIDGCGKSTQVARLVRLLAAGDREVVSLREPGGTAISEKVRALLLDPANAEMSATCELLLYEASRAQLVSQTIEPALMRGAVVVCDRFYDSTTAYQQAARGLDASVVASANALGSCGVSPDVTILLDLDPVAAFSRATCDGADRLEAEGLAFQRDVREGYLGIAAGEPHRVHVVDATGAEDEVFGRILRVLEDIPTLAGLAHASVGEGA